jgi:anti-anti-sigma factor
MPGAVHAVPPEPPDLSVRTTHADGVTTVVLDGEIDLYNSITVTLEFELILRRDPAPNVLRVDLRGVTFMDSIGLAVLLRAR